MNRSTITPMDALRRCVEAMKLIDFADCKDERVWQAIGDAQGVAEGALRDYVEQEPIGTLARGDDSILFTPLYDFHVFDGMHVYISPVDTQPSHTALGDEVIAALDAMHAGCNEKSWIGWQNGDGEEVGTRLQKAINAYKAAAPSIAAPAEVERDAKRYRFLCENAHRMHIDLTDSQEFINKQLDAAIATGEKHDK